MGLGSWYKTRRLERTRAKLARLESSQLKSSGLSDLSDVSALVLGDGFIPAVSLDTDSLDVLYESATWSYAAMSANAEVAASLPGIVQRSGRGPGEASWVGEPDHALNEFLRNPFGPGIQPAWNWNQLLETLGLQLYLCGNAYLPIEQVDGGERFFVDLWNPQDVEIISDGTRPVAYRYTPRARGQGSFRAGVIPPAGPSVTLPADQVVHITMASAGSLIEGRAPIEPSRRPMEIDRTSQERVKANLINRLGIGLVVSFDQAFGPTREQRDDLEAYLKEKFQKATRDGSPLVLGSKAKVESVPGTIDQLAYFDVRKFAREEILAIFRTPPPILGVLENATLQNFAQSRRIWWSVALEPLLKTVLWAINAQAVRPVYGDGVRLWFDLADSEIGLDILSNKADVAKKLIDLGYSTNLANARVDLGMPFVPELDESNSRFVVAGREENLNEEPAEVDPGEPAPAQLEVINDG